jgi:hypothetical protein
MKPYGMSKVEYINDSKKAGDLFNRNAVFSSTGTRNALRIFKKRARRIGKATCRDDAS